MAAVATKDLECHSGACRGVIPAGDPVVWLGSDASIEFHGATEIDRYPFHPACADAPWPLFACDPPEPPA